MLNDISIHRSIWTDFDDLKHIVSCSDDTRKQGSCLEKEIMQGTMPGARRRGRPCTAWMDNIKTWTGLPVEELIRTTEDRDKLTKCVHALDRGRLKNRTEQNSDDLSGPASAVRSAPWVG